MTRRNDSRDTFVKEENFSLDKLCTEEKNKISRKISSSIAMSTAIPSIDVLDNDDDNTNTNETPPVTPPLPQDTLTTIENKIASREIRPGLTRSNIEVNGLLLQNKLIKENMHVAWKLLDPVNAASSIVGLADNLNIDGGEEMTKSSQPVLQTDENYEDKSQAEVATKHTTILSNPTEDSTHRSYSLTTNSMTLTTSSEERKSGTNWFPRRTNRSVSKILTKPMINRRKQQWLCSLREPENNDRKMEMVFFEVFRSKNNE